MCAANTVKHGISRIRVDSPGLPLRDLELSSISSTLSSVSRESRQTRD